MALAPYILNFYNALSALWIRIKFFLSTNRAKYKINTRAVPISDDHPIGKIT